VKKILTLKEIKEHPLLDADHQTMAREMREVAQGTRERFTMLDFAEICLRASARNYVDADDIADNNDGRGDTTAKTVMAAREMQRAAIFYVHEALKGCDIALITEWPEFDEMLKNLVTLSEDIL